MPLAKSAKSRLIMRCRVKYEEKMGVVFVSRRMHIDPPESDKGSMHLQPAYGKDHVL